MGSMRLLAACAACALLAAGDGAQVLAQARVERGFTTGVSERLMDAYTRRFGPAARGRLEKWKRYAAERKSLAESVI